MITPAIVISAGSGPPRRNCCGSGFISHAVTVSTTFIFRSFSLYLSSGCPLTKKPSTSFSFCSRVCSSHAGTLGSASTCDDATTTSESKIPNSPDCPESLSFCAFCARSIAPSSAAITCSRLPSESIAPALINDSSTRLFISRRSTFSQNSHRLAKPVLPVACSSARAASTDSIALWPTFLIAARPNRIASTCSPAAFAITLGVKLASEICTSGGTTAMPSSRHSEMYLTTFSGFDVSLVSSAAINSTG